MFEKMSDIAQEEISQKEFINQLTKALDDENTEKALNLFTNDSFNDVINRSSWDITPVVASHLTKENRKCKKDFFDCCIGILNAVAEKCNPSETVLEFLEQAEYSEDDTKFHIILNLLSKCLQKTTDKTKAIEWCVNTIKSYIESLPLPENEELDIAEATAKKDVNLTVQRLIDINAAVISFLEPLVTEVVMEGQKGDLHRNYILENYLLSLLIYLSGRPFCHLHDCHDDQQSKKNIVLASYITKDLLKFFNVVDKRGKRCMQNSMKRIDQEYMTLESTLFESEDNVPSLAYANFYFDIITTADLWEQMPQVYNPHYMFQVCIYLANCFLQERHCVLISKGLRLLEASLRWVEKSSIDPGILKLSIFYDILRTLSNVTIFCNSEKERKKALLLFQQYIQVFDMEARYLILLRLYRTTEHSGLLSFIGTLFKSFIVECLQTDPPCTAFLGKNMETLLKEACKLPHGSASDLVEISDEIVTALNLLRYLSIRDKNNTTGFWNIIDALENSYLQPLREGIKMCRAHWNAKAKDLEQEKKMHGDERNFAKTRQLINETTLFVGGEQLPPMPVSQRIAFCRQVLNGLDVMESVLIRVNECVANNNPLRLHSA